MDQWAGALIQLGVAGVGLYLFVNGKLLSEATAARLLALLDARIAEWRERYLEMREDRDAWRELALGNERSLDLARPIVAEVVGVPVDEPEQPSPSPRSALRARREGRYTAPDQALRRGTRRR